MPSGIPPGITANALWLTQSILVPTYATRTCEVKCRVYVEGVSLRLVVDQSANLLPTRCYLSWAILSTPLQAGVRIHRLKPRVRLVGEGA